MSLASHLIRVALLAAVLVSIAYARSVFAVGFWFLGIYYELLLEFVGGEPFDRRRRIIIALLAVVWPLLVLFKFWARRSSLPADRASGEVD